MIRKLPVLLAVVLFACFPPNALALDAATSASNLKDQVRIIKEQKNTAVSKIKEDARIAIKAKRDEFKAKLQTIKDLKKRAILENLNTKLADINKKNTDRFSELLTKLQAITDNAKLKTTDAKTVSNIAAAQTAIDTARTAVADQAAKEYTVQITSETALRSDANSTISQLKKDLSVIHKLVINAKQAVQLLKPDINAVKKTPPAGNGATSSANL